MDWTYPLLIIYMILMILPLYLFIYADTQGNGTNGIISRFLLNTIPSICSRNLEHFCGSRINNAFHSTYDYIANQRNPIMQILYVILINGAFITWMVSGMNKLPTFLVSESQGYISVAFVMFAQFTYALACTVGPGCITNDNVKCFAHQPFDGLMYVPGSYCSSCQVAKVSISVGDLLF